VDAKSLKQKLDRKNSKGWPIKALALLHSRFKEVLLLDADNVAVMNPEFLFATPQFKQTGAIFWPDYGRPTTERACAIWRSCGLRIPAEPEFESGQIVVEKEGCWRALNLALWFNQNSRFYYQYIYGDKETFHIAFRKMKKSYALIPTRIHRLHGTMCQHDFSGRRIFQHRNTAKWELFTEPERIKDFWFEDECIRHLKTLRKLWDGKVRTGAEKSMTVKPHRRMFHTHAQSLHRTPADCTD
jgi:hypothetical protein